MRAKVLEIQWVPSRDPSLRVMKFEGYHFLKDSVGGCINNFHAWKCPKRESSDHATPFQGKVISLFFAVKSFVQNDFFYVIFATLTRSIHSIWPVPYLFWRNFRLMPCNLQTVRILNPLKMLSCQSTGFLICNLLFTSSVNWAIFLRVKNTFVMELTQKNARKVLLQEHISLIIFIFQFINNIISDPKKEHSLSSIQINHLCWFKSTSYWYSLEYACAVLLLGSCPSYRATQIYCTYFLPTQMNITDSTIQRGSWKMRGKW